MESGKPFVVFLDEVDGLFGEPGSNDSKVDARIIKEFQTNMQGIEEQEGQIIVVAATNYPEQLPGSILSRFGKRLHIKLPRYEDRKRMIKLCLRTRDCIPDLYQEDYGKLAALTKNASGREIDELVENAIDEQISQIKKCKWWRKTTGSKYLPCDKNDRRAMEMGIKKVGDKGKLPPLNFDHFGKAIKNCGISQVRSEDIKKHCKFEEQGQRMS